MVGGREKKQTRDDFKITYESSRHQGLPKLNHNLYFQCCFFGIVPIAVHPQYLFPGAPSICFLLISLRVADKAILLCTHLKILSNSWTEEYGMQKQIAGLLFHRCVCWPFVFLCLAFTVFFFCFFFEIRVGSLSIAITPCNPSLCLTPLLHAYFLGQNSIQMSATFSIIGSVSLFLKLKIRGKERARMRNEMALNSATVTSYI